MKREDIKNILGEGATEEQITNLLNAFHNSNKEEKNTITELQSKIANMSDYDSIKNQLDEINKAKQLTAQKLKEANIICNTAKVKSILAGENISEELLKTLVNEDENVSVANANALKEALTSLKDTVEKQTKASLVNTDLKPSITNVNQNEDVMTFQKFADLSAEDQEKFIKEHPEEYQKF